LLALLFIFSAAWRTAASEPVAVRHLQGSMHGFLVLKSEDGKVIAVGDLINVTHGTKVRSRLVFHFRDGSIDDEVTVFRQSSVFRLISDHHVQKGPSFPEPMDMTVDASTGQVTWMVSKDGKQETKTEHMDLPPDLANGLVQTVLENLPPGVTETKASYLAGDPKPRVVGFSIKREDKAGYEVVGAKRQGIEYNIHVELGGVAGVVAPIIGKQPSDMQIWVMEGEVPAFLRLRGSLYVKGPIWTMELASPRWPSTAK
jgi:hypothetical protein